jgi:hypothetical protein
MTPPHPRASVRSRLPGAVAPAEARSGQGGEDAQAVLLEALRRSDRELRALAREQTAMRRVAALVAGDGAPDDLFALVAEEVAALLDADGGRVVRFGTDGRAVVVGGWRTAGCPPSRRGPRWASTDGAPSPPSAPAPGPPGWSDPIRGGS